MIRSHNKDLEFLQQVLENCNDAFVVIDQKGNIIYENKMHRNLIDSLIKKPTTNSPKDYLDKSQYHNIITSLKKERQHKEEIKLLTKYPNRIYIEINSYIITNERENYYVFIEKNISKYKHNIKKFKTLFNSAYDLIFIYDLQGNYLEVNDAACRNLGYSRSELILKHQFDICESLDKKEFIEKLNVLKVKKNLLSEIIFISKNGSKIPVELSEQVISFEGDVAVLSIARDITVRKKFEKEIIKSKEKAEESDKLKSAFLSNMSHEIRTPMNAIVGFSDLLRKENLSEYEKQEYINYIKSNSNTLLRLINDILDVAKIESKQLTLRKINIDVNKILDEIYVETILRLKNKNKEHINLIYKKIKETDPVLYTDPLRLKQIINNLIGNSIKFTEKGSIEYGVNTYNNFFQFYVKDTGIGIPKDKLKLIFERFQQVSDPHVYGGTGLGLAIARNLTMMLGGDIWVTSTLHSGSAFYFTIPILKKPEIKKEKTATDLKNYNFSDKTVLIVEDEESNYKVIAKLLEYSKTKVIWAKDGIEAVKIVEEEKTNIDLILMDLILPKMNGYEATGIINKKNKDIPIIAISACSFPEDKQRSLDAGCVEYLMKPVHSAELVKYICKYLDYSEKKLTIRNN